ncbi:DUF6364 family protein [Ottowia sp.]|uniref:DUF6364 family protein n=1 Tax=Ottowia sp. TaxID=1898956 RepID=UPI0039E36ACB
MQTKLTLRLDADLIEQAKAQAGRRGKSLSQLVADYFAQLNLHTNAPAVASAPLPPVVASLRGALKGARADLGEQSYRDHLESKHR